MNVVGVANAVTSFLPLIKQGKAKKVITLSSGMADLRTLSCPSSLLHVEQNTFIYLFIILDLVNEFSVGLAAPYTISKAAVNALVAKYNVAYGSQGILFMSISPGFVDTSEGKSSKLSFRLHSQIVCLHLPGSPEELKLLAPMVEAFKKYNPAFTGPITPQQSVENVMKLAARATIEDYGGSFVSHHGDKNWL